MLSSTPPRQLSSFLYQPNPKSIFFKESSKFKHDLCTISDLSKALKDVDSMKTQSENLTNEYDRLLEEKDKLERRLAVFGDGDKKDD